MARVILAILALVVGAAASAGQEAPVARIQALSLVAGLQAARWSDRASSYEHLRSDPASITKPEVRMALIDLLDRENHADLSKEPDFNPNDGEQYAEYIGALVDTVISFVDWKDSRQLCILAHIALDPDSSLAAKLAATGELIVPCLMKMSESSESRYNAVALLIQLRARADDVSSELMQKICTVTIAALRDRDEMVRVGAVHALGNFGGEDMIPELEQVAQSDPAPEIQGQSIRNLAAKAISAIRKRAHNGQQAGPTKVKP